MGTRGSGGDDGIDHQSAKHLLDSIGGIIQKQAQDDADNFRKQLQGHLSQATYNGVNTGVTSACQLHHEFETSGTTGKTNPCLNRSPVRFSDTQGAYCSRKGIKGNDNINNARACAPYRRLHLCDKNLEQIKPYQINNTHNLLADVCLAAKYEGESLVDKHKAYKETHNDFNTNICTVLARSFADIGDIIRGKDLFLGHKQRKNQLETSLKTMFENIKENNISLNTLTNEQIREYWWALNRKQVWKAITCKAADNDNYLKTTENGTITQLYSKCGHYIEQDVPLNLDYVPQFLRWFYEWAEDFCTKRKKKIQNAIKNCRGEKNDKYCDLNGYDCTKTIRGENKLVSDMECTKCSSSCIPFVDWIDNQRKEFEKQKNKYSDEIKKGEATNEISNEKINNVYENEFYKKLQEKYGDVEKFLKKLSEEQICKNHPEVGDEKKNYIDFNDDVNKTFSHTQYCQACPWCGVEQKGPPWKSIHENVCRKKKEKTITEQNTTPIPRLSPDRRKRNILQKYNTFCVDTENKYKEIRTWQCHYEKNDEGDENGDSNDCVLGDWENLREEDKIMSYYSFFWSWVDQMLEDSIEWREQLKTCREYAKSNYCIERCKNPCGCYKKWVKRMKEEWDSIEQHFDKQGDLKGSMRNTTLKWILQLFFIKKIEDAYGKDKCNELMKKIEETKRHQRTGDTQHSQDAIKILLQHEEDDATKCIGTHKDPCDSRNRYSGRIDSGSRVPGQPPSSDHDDEELHDSDDEDEAPKPKGTRTNPCSGESGKKEYPVLAEKVAADIHKKAHEEMLKRSGKVASSESLLRANAKLGQYNGGHNGSDLAMGEICKIEKKHSKAATDDSKNPCNGKGDGYDIGTPWNGGELGSITPEMYIRPRREHMCTSNLEKLDDNSVIKNSNVNDTFLLEVLHAAKSEADWIKNKYEGKKDGQNKDKNGLNDGKTVCRAMKSSFADIGDIIRGKDLWDKGQSSTDIQNKLKTIFGKIKTDIESKLGNKYNDNKDPKHLKLRADWWEANRDQVWQAMKCHIKDLKDTSIGSSEGHCGYSNTTPLDDYIPQRLRWMTEWAEWYCKYQSKEYDELMNKCGSCKGNDNGKSCIQGTAQCISCRQACDEYKNKIEPWKKQWQQMPMKYTSLYLQAQTITRGTVFPDADYQEVVDFFKELQKKNGDTTTTTPITPYGSAAGYIHQEAHITECQEQNVFCSNNGNKDKYAFKDTPKDHNDACNCQSRPPPAKKPEGDHNDLGRSERSGEDGMTPRLSPQPPQEKSQEPKVEDVCQIVGDALGNQENITKTCQQKYGTPNRYWGWKCVTTGSNTGSTTSNSEGVNGATGRQGRSADSPPSGSSNQGSICIPPRRRKLYLHKVDTMGTDTASLRDWFVKSASVETFFLWHRYKKIKEKEDIEKQQLVTNTSDAGNTLQKDLEGGEIDDEFKRQMFYTLGDYRDILFGKSIVVDLLKNSNINGDKEMKEREKDIKTAIEKHFNSENNKATGDNPFSTGNNEATRGKSLSTSDKTPQTGQTSSNSGKDPSSWWENNAKHIWKGMICSLSYDIQEDKTIKKNEQVETKLKEKLDKDSGEYAYEKVTFKGGFDDDSSTSKPMGTKESSDAYKTTKTELDAFVKRPFFFRWLEEWADEFCTKRTHKLKIIEKECHKDGNRNCDDDGFECKEMCLKKDGSFETLKCPSCAISCKSYKKWIERKKDEFNKQKGKYEQEIQKLESTSNDIYDKQFVEKLSSEYKSFDLFLENLKGEPCKIESGEDKKEDDYIKFKEEETFQPAKDCKPCSTIGFKCIGDDSSGVTENGCNGKTFNIKEHSKNTKNDSEEVGMLVSDNKEETFAGDLNAACSGTGIFTGIKNDQWSCGNVCGLDICELKTSDEQKNDKQIILIRALLKRWVENFLEDYNKIKHKISHCIKKGDRTPCINGCEQKCKCVEKWVQAKRTEWKTVRERYINQYRDKNSNEAFELKSFLEQGPFHNEVLKAIKPCSGLTAFANSCGLNGDKPKEKKGGEEDTPKDIVECLLNRLGEKAKTCDESQKTSCKDPSLSGETPHLVGDDDDSLEEEYQTPEDAQKMIPTICKDAIKPTKPEEEDEKCDSADNSETKKTEEEGKEEQEERETSGGPAAGGEEEDKQKPNTDDDKDLKAKEEGPVPAPVPPPAPEPRPVPQPPPQPPPQLDQPTKPISDILSSTIPFGIAIALTSFALFFIKKKTKSSVDMLRVLQIPQNDYGMPTLKSSNKYIPYTSGKYRGKRYIYLEGDSGTDSGYTDHYSDITSSSESEYEEFDINDIYVPGSPKYKTLIEVVLEPSKRDTQSGDTIPTSDIPNTPSDTPPPTSDIPSPITDNEWNQLKNDFISNMLQSEQPNDVPNNYRSGDIPLNTHPTPSHDTLDQKPFIMSIHHRNLYTGDEYNYDMTTNSANNDLYSGKNNLYSGNNDLYSDIYPTSDNRDSYSDKNAPISDNHHPYSGIDLINDTLSGNQHIDIYDEILKRKENELFGTNHHPKRTTNHFSKPTNSDPIMNQLDLFHKWLDRHRDIGEKWENKVDILNHLKEKWENETHSGNKTSGNITPTSDIPSGKLSDIPSGKISDIPSSNKMLNTDVSIQIDMDDDPKNTNEFTYVDSNPNLTLPSNPNLVGNNINPVDENPTNPNHVQIQMSVKNTQMAKEKYPISDMWDI
ncbi:erythrocyte membrane protein 1, EMP1 [Plasmodium reichenowi]|uniref:Erythrocyte membrane protein 1, EMP1 n=1 Tax=Plasmodium reichenowi TaxID=5854 RepID=A0A060RM79_PLARE|nr:erythrocyte membrane protein 1, EMP1 [Plasmodium reichenowi]